ncbi:cyclase family protein [Anaerofustis stercorihominis]|uniref:cyclase family protein n=1 Tax=Anaerofustis stercorihominis TaxID=214853 RepID=UPI00214CE45B|nr:cyclase family protein [Anaerofustis stercorihominis]MCR2032982.1 cyclase family protein [Anaerofustis stercorihominis]
MNIIDLTNVIETDMTVYPSDPEVKVEEVLIHSKDHCHVDKLTMGTHTGTHIDVPFHFNENGKTVTDYGVESFIGRGALIDVSYKKNNEVIFIDDLEPFGEAILKSDFAVIRTGYDKYFNSEDYISHPYLSKEAAVYLKSMGIKLVGIDTFSVDSTYNNDNFDAHDIFLSNDILIVENLANLDKLDINKNYIFHFVPLKIKNGDGSPVRAYAAEV